MQRQSHHASHTKAKGVIKKENIRSELCMERLIENLGLVKQPKRPGALTLDPTRGVYSVSFEPPAHIAYGHKAQSFMKNGGQQKCLDKALMFFSSIKEINSK